MRTNGISLSHKKTKDFNEKRQTSSAQHYAHVQFLFFDSLYTESLQWFQLNSWPLTFALWFSISFCILDFLQYIFISISIEYYIETEVKLCHLFSDCRSYRMRAELNKNIESKWWRHRVKESFVNFATADFLYIFWFYGACLVCLVWLYQKVLKENEQKLTNEKRREKTWIWMKEIRKTVSAKR